MMRTNSFCIIFILLSFYSICLGQNLYGDLIINGSFQEQKLKDILEHIDQNYPVDFYYSIEDWPEQSFSRNFENTGLSEVLSNLLQSTGIDYIKFSNYAYAFAASSAIEKTRSDIFFQPSPTRTQSIQESITEEPFIRIGDPDNPSSRNLMKITGRVLDQKTGTGLLGATILVEDTDYSAVSGPEGSYDLSLPKGIYNLQISYVGYENYETELQIFNDGEWQIELQSSSQNLETVIVTEQALDENVRSAQMGIERLSISKIKELPSLLGEADIIKSLLTLPGVSTVGEGASGFNVRGGSIDQNLILADGAPLFNPTHVFGFFTSLNADAVKGVTLYKGNIPAQYGGRISSVLDIELRDGSFEDFKVSGGIGLVTSKLTVETPLVKDQSSILVGGRASYSDWMLQTVKNTDVRNSSAVFYDFNAKLTHRINSKSLVSGSYYQSFDRFRFSDEFGFSWAAKAASLSWNKILSEQLSLNLSGAWGDNENLQFSPTLIDAFDLRNGLGYLKIKPDLLWSPGLHNIHFGAEWIRYQADPESFSPRDANSAVIPKSVRKDSGQEWGIYINDEFDLGSRFSFSAGIRLSSYQQLGPTTSFEYQEGIPRSENSVVDSINYDNNQIVQTYWGLEPRLSMRYQLGPNNSIKLAYNRLRQYIHLISNTSSATPIDIWQVSTANIPPQTADNYSIGYFQNFRNNNWETSLEFYYRDITDLVDYKDLASLFLNEFLDAELLIGKGRAYGGEMAIQKNRGQMTGSLSYTYSRTLRQVQGDIPEERINNGDWFPSNYDQPHNVKLNLNFNLSKKQKLAFNVVYNTGRPVTIPISNYQLFEKIIPHFSERNFLRIPDYFRVDVSYTLNRKAVRRSGFKDSFVLSIYNILGRRNAYSIFFERDLNANLKAFKLSVIGTAIPSLSYNFKIGKK